MAQKFATEHIDCGGAPLTLGVLARGTGCVHLLVGPAIHRQLGLLGLAAAAFPVVPFEEVDVVVEGKRMKVREVAEVPAGELWFMGREPSPHEWRADWIRDALKVRVYNVDTSGWDS